MTAKQRAARAKFKAIVKEASKLRKKNPKLTQAQAVKQAWAISYGKAGKKKVGAVPKKKAAKKSATKVKAKKRSTTEQHTDTKSHNVNIKVVSGINYEKHSAEKISQLSKIMNDIRHNEEMRDRLKDGIKYKKYTKESNKIARKLIKDYVAVIKNLKQQFRTVKNQITI